MKHLSISDLLTRFLFYPCICLVVLLVSTNGNAGGFVDIESGVAFTGYNDVRIPAKTATTISLKDDTASEPTLALRLRVGTTFNDRHTLLVLAAPLTVRGEGTLDRDVTYQNKTFVKGTKIESSYRFDSYRITYRYSFIRKDTFTLAAGLTGKIRSADIAIMSETAYAHRSDLGAVPLINLMMDWKFTEKLGLLFEVDALVTPFGRAEDGILALQYYKSDRATLRLGYRVLEGGSEGGGSVYTFSLFHYAMAGIMVKF